MNKSRPLAFKRLPLASAVASLITLSVAASAKENSANFNIPAQSMNEALIEYSEQANVQVAVDSNAIKGMKSHNVEGTFSSTNALGTLLNDSGLTYSMIGDDTVAIKRLEGTPDSGKILLASNYQQSQPRTSVQNNEVAQQSNKDAAIKAQSTTNETEGQKVEKIAVVGSAIANKRIEAALPVAVFDQTAIDAVGALDGNELVRSMPQMGDITWNEAWIPGSSNAARGDMGSLNLKNLGASNTLLLINGRRSVIHPTTSTVDNSMSTTTFNTNAIPMYGLERVEVLLDGAAAIYGSDAIAGVVNIVTQDNIDGAGIKVKYGSAEGTNRADTEVTGYFGTDFDSGRGNVSVMYNLFHRAPQYTSDQWYTATSDRRSFLNGTDLEGSASLDGRWPYTPWGNFVAPYQLVQNGVPISSAAGYFHAELPNSADCNTGEVNSVCFASGGVSRPYYYDPGKENTYLTPRVDRYNVFSTFVYQLTDDMDIFGEAALYKATSELQTGSGVFSVNTPVYIPADAYYNPLGAATLDDGSINPYRIPGLDNVPQAGSVVELRNYMFADAGVRDVNVDNTQSRFLLGVKGWTYSGFNWESAILYSQGKAVDESEGFSVMGIVEALSGTTAEAYNPFNGGAADHITYGDDTPNSASVIDSFTVTTTRESKSEIASWDFKVNNANLVGLPAGDLGFAAGVEVRYESLQDDRDPLVDGTNTYTDWYTGFEYTSDLAGTSPTPDSYGSRNVKSAYVELAVPLVAPEFDIPLVQSLDMQLAGRYESYSDVGDISTPKVAIAWGVYDDLMFRGSWSEGFKAPNLEVLNADEMARYLTFPDYSFCEAAVRQGQIENYSQCTRSYAVTWHMAGNEDLNPETSTNQSFGAVYTPTFMPDSWGNFRMTLDAWKIEIDDQIGVTNTLDVIIHDLYLRTVENSSDPRVVRAAPNSDDIADFAGTGLDPVGEIQYVQTDYENLNSLEAKGVDFIFDWSSSNTDYGKFSFNFALSRLVSYKQALTAEMQAAKDAQDAGLIDPFIAIGTADEVGINGKKPEWKASSRLIWSNNQFTYRLSAKYTGSVIDGRYASGANFDVPSVTIWNTSAQYTFEDTAIGDMTTEVGIRNLFDKEPPLNASGNYLANLYLPFSRYLYASVETRF